MPADWLPTWYTRLPRQKRCIRVARADLPPPTEACPALHLVGLISRTVLRTELLRTEIGEGVLQFVDELDQILIHFEVFPER